MWNLSDKVTKTRLVYGSKGVEEIKTSVLSGVTAYVMVFRSIADNSFKIFTYLLEVL